MINRKRLRAIAELTVAGGFDKMPEEQLDAYLDCVNSFVDSFPILAQKLQDAVDDQEPASLIADMFSAICKDLSMLHAGSIVNSFKPEFDNLINTYTIDYISLEAIVENFIQTVSSFSIDIQMAMRNDAALNYERSSSDNTNVHKILAVDNAVMYLNTLKMMLENTPYELHCTTSCAEALEYAKNENPSMLLLDIEMPEMNGYELARRIKAEGCCAPIIFITANSAREYVDKAMEVGAQGLLIKPIRSARLLSKIAELI